MTDFPSLAFQGALGIEAILFAVLGFLYSVYALYASSLNKTSPSPGSVLIQLRFLGRSIVFLILINAVIAVYALLNTNLSGTVNIILASGLVITMISMIVISVILAFRHM